MSDEKSPLKWKFKTGEVIAKRQDGKLVPV